MNDIGEGDNALLCVTDSPDCCKPTNGPLQGEFYYPDNTLVRNQAQNYSLYRNRGPQVIRLNRRSDVLLITGVYRCEIPDSTGTNQSIYITGLYKNNIIMMFVKFNYTYISVASLKMP